jgi:hypothetical protein
MDYAVCRAEARNFSLPRSGEGLERGCPARLCALGNQISLEGPPKGVGELLPNRLGFLLKIFWCFYTQWGGGRPRSSPSPLRGYCRLRQRVTLVNRCVLAIQLSACADVTARRSVTHLTFANPFWCPVRTFLVLLHTEAGGMPAFQSLAASRRLSAVPTGTAC